VLNETSFGEIAVLHLAKSILKKIKEKNMSKEEKFWNWFKKSNSRYYFLNQISDRAQKEKLLDEFLEHLHSYCDKLFFEIGGIPNENMELIISAGGDKNFFSVAEVLIQHAPKIDDWRFIALKPPMGTTFISNYENIELNPQKMWFLPLENDDNPEQLGLRLYFEKFAKQNDDLFLNAGYQILDTLLGEKNTALQIQHVEVEKLPKDPAKNGLMKMKDLPEYIRWRNEKVKK
jgi:hypothetical protein